MTDASEKQLGTDWKQRFVESLPVAWEEDDGSTHELRTQKAGRRLPGPRTCTGVPGLGRGAATKAPPGGGCPSEPQETGPGPHSQSAREPELDPTRPASEACTHPPNWHHGSCACSEQAVGSQGPGRKAGQRCHSGADNEKQERAQFIDKQESGGGPVFICSCATEYSVVP